MVGVSLTDGVPLPLAIAFWKGFVLQFNERAVSILVPSLTCTFRWPFVTKLYRLPFNTGSLRVDGQQRRGGDGRSGLYVFLSMSAVVAWVLSGSPTLSCCVE